jgi:1,4-alpha-glucan branching enzyme
MGKKTHGVTKEYLPGDSSCRLTFKLPIDAVGRAGRVAVVGDFNGWDQEASPMRKRKDGGFEITLDLPAGREYRFRYLIDGHRWENDWCADRYERNHHGSDDSVVVV